MGAAQRLPVWVPKAQRWTVFPRGGHFANLQLAGVGAAGQARGGMTLDEADAALKKMADKVLQTEPPYSQETILAYRKLAKAKAFERAVRERTPVDLDTDEATLACGHKVVLSAKTLDLKLSLAYDDHKIHCRHCVREWLEKA
jgi:hypothetical protein